MTSAEIAKRLTALLADLNPNAVLWDGLEAAIIGIGLRDGNAVAIYDYNAMVMALISQGDGWTLDDALEWIEYNVIGGYVGSGTPLVTKVRDPWAEDDDEDNADLYYGAGEE